MRILRVTAALLLGLAGAVFVPSTASAVTGASISLSPTRGTAATTLTATYRYSDSQQGFHVCFTDDINFRWSGLSLGRAPLTWDKPAAQCVARLSGLLAGGTAPASSSGPLPLAAGRNRRAGGGGRGQLVLPPPSHRPVRCRAHLRRR